jgi:hypothetical protein
MNRRELFGLLLAVPLAALLPWREKAYARWLGQEARRSQALLGQGWVNCGYDVREDYLICTEVDPESGVITWSGTLPYHSSGKRWYLVSGYGVSGSSG